MKQSALIFVFAVLSGVVGPGRTSAAPLQPLAHGTFAHYTFALTWQPGFCSVDEGCLSDQPTSPLIGLHGLWASRPRSLIAAGIAPQKWWQHGCGYYSRGEGPPKLDSALTTRLKRVMPHLRSSLLTHEYEKHVQCFAFNPSLFFTTELTMRDAVARSAFGHYLLRHIGTEITHADVVRNFKSAFHTTVARALQLQCGHSASGQPILTQLWFTIRADRLQAFPRPESLTQIPINQDSCPATFRVPDWRR
ncbi:MAG: ribonuclease I [Candidatus Eremiobacteraeota bacterium]|nr:ribonuclease I [Candidatus Eremiobacteraeota bacterium]